MDNVKTTTIRYTYWKPAEAVITLPEAEADKLYNELKQRRDIRNLRRI